MKGAKRKRTHLHRDGNCDPKWSKWLAEARAAFDKALADPKERALVESYYTAAAPKLTDADNKRLYLVACQIMAARDALKKMPGGKKTNDFAKNLKDAEGEFVFELAGKFRLESHTWPKERLGVRFDIGRVGGPVRATFYHITR